MFKGNRIYIIILTALFLLLIVLQYNKPQPIDWSPSYSKKDKIPYGTHALRSLLEKNFPEQNINNSKQTIYGTLHNKDFSNYNYIFINSEFNPDKLNAAELLAFVEKGNHAFIAARNFEDKFCDTLRFSTASDDALHLQQNGKNKSIDLAGLNAIPVNINFSNPALKSPIAYRYKKSVSNHYFSKLDTAVTTILGCDENNRVNFINIKLGKGSLFIHTLPDVFTNYNFVHPKNSEYVYKAFSYLPNTDVIWDEYYKVGNVITTSPFRFIFSNDSLMSAYYLLLITTIVFMLFALKRKQRIIPVMVPLKNTTLEFTEVVGTLYFQTGDHKNVANKKIIYFLEYLRANFQVKTSDLGDEDVLKRIANLSGISEEKVISLFRFIHETQEKTSISDTELLKLNAGIEDFLKESKR